MIVPSAYEDGLDAAAPQIMSLDGQPSYRRWGCPLCGNWAISMQSQTGDEERLKAKVSAHLSDCPAIA